MLVVAAEFYHVLFELSVHGLAAKKVFFLLMRLIIDASLELLKLSYFLFNQCLFTLVILLQMDVLNLKLFVFLPQLFELFVVREGRGLSSTMALGPCLSQLQVLLYQYFIKLSELLLAN